MNRDQLIAILTGLAETCRNGERDYRAIASLIAGYDPSTRSIFKHYALQRARFVRRLEMELRVLGYSLHAPPRPFANETAGDQCNSTRNELISECVRNEAMAEEQHARALQADLPLHIQAQIKTQYMQIKEARSRMRGLEHDALYTSVSPDPSTP